jgi:hypothetical protein
MVRFYWCFWQLSACLILNFALHQRQILGVPPDERSEGGFSWNEASGGENRLSGAHHAFLSGFQFFSVYWDELSEMLSYRGEAESRENIASFLR